jgi:hypothetical protein
MVVRRSDFDGTALAHMSDANMAKLLTSLNSASASTTATLEDDPPVLVDVVSELGFDVFPHGSPFAFNGVDASGTLKANPITGSGMPYSNTILPGLIYGDIPPQGRGKAIIRGPIGGLYLPQWDENEHSQDGYHVGNSVMYTSTGLGPWSDFAGLRQIHFGRVLKTGITDGVMYVDIKDVPEDAAPSVVDGITTAQLAIGTPDLSGETPGQISNIIRHGGFTGNFNYRLPFPHAGVDGSMPESGTFQLGDGSFGPRFATNNTTDANPATANYEFASGNNTIYVPAFQGLPAIFLVNVEVVGLEFATGDFAIFHLRAVVHRAFDGTVTLRTPTVIFADSLAGGAHATWTTTLAIADNVLSAKPTGEAGKNIQWRTKYTWVSR